MVGLAAGLALLADPVHVRAKANAAPPEEELKQLFVEASNPARQADAIDNLAAHPLFG